MYYKNKISTLKAIFGTDKISLERDHLIVDKKRYPVIDDVIILSRPDKQSAFVKKRLERKEVADENAPIKDFAEDIQYSFGEEWKDYDNILSEHKDEFQQYFDLVNLRGLPSSRLCDLGCGNGRWSYYLKDAAKEIILVDFSDAIFVARKNLSGADNCLFFMCDLRDLPFKDNFADMVFCIGVLHHLPTPALDEVRSLKRFSPALLIYLYYSLDNKPFYFRLILKTATALRLCTSKVRSPLFRKVFSKCGVFLLYMPLILLGRLLNPLKLSRFIPLYETYHDKSVRRIQQDVYDRFFTSIEQRVSRNEILRLKDTFTHIAISENKPYWHFLCQR